MKKILALAVLFMGTISGVMAQTITKVDVSVFPKPENGYKQVVIEVPHSDLDSSKKIEFKVGKWMEVDGCNYFNLMGTLEEKDLSGWGYSYYTFETKGEVTSTMMACPDSPKRNLFVTALPQLTRYNGKMPIVIYVPEGYDVTYSIYKTDGEVYKALEVRNKK